MKKKFWIKTRVFLWFWLFVISFINIFLYLLYLWFEKSFISWLQSNIEKTYNSIKDVINKSEWHIINIPNKDLEEFKEMWFFTYIWKNDKEIQANYSLWYYFYWENIVFRWDYNWYNILIWKNISDFISYKRKILEIIFIADFLWILIILMMTYFITNRLLKPLIELSKHISKYDIEKNKDLIKNNFWESEIWIMTESINKLITKSKNILESQKRFIQDSSHELKTPLMQIDSNIEILEEKIIDENFRKKLENIKKASENINKIVSNLWFILRNESIYKTEKINIKKYLKEFIKNYDNELKQKNISVKIDEYFDLEIESNTYFLDRLFWNLIQNSIFYNDWNNEIKIEIFEDKITLEDKWIWIKEDEIKNIFERFYRNSDSKIYYNWWNWLGLTIVKKICDDFWWKIDVKSKVWFWTKFQINLK